MTKLLNKIPKDFTRYGAVHVLWNNERGGRGVKETAK